MPKKTWETYEDVTRAVLSDLREYLGVGDILGKKKYKGKITEWEIEASSYEKEDKSKLVIVECRRYTTSRLSQETVGGFSYRIDDLIATRGIIVTPLGLQKGAQKIADAKKITTITLDPNARSDNYIARISNQLFGKFTEHISITEHVSIKLE
jgi:hypothetical protein